jgi:site-specific DNA-cytosine methylase
MPVAEARNKVQAVAFMENQRSELRVSETANLTVGGGKPGQGYPAALQGSAVRRLTPRECERLQGFPEIHRELKVLVCASEDEKSGRAASAERASAAPSLAPNAPVAVDVLIDLERSGKFGYTVSEGRLGLRALRN